MNREYEAGEKIEYSLSDKNGKAHWFKGVIHAVKRYEDPETNMTVRVSYLVDTGRNTSEEKIVFNHRDREFQKRLDDRMLKGKSYKKSLEEVSQHTDLPDSKIDTEIVRQPEQIELAPDKIRAIE